MTTIGGEIDLEVLTRTSCDRGKQVSFDNSSRSQDFVRR